MVFLSFLSFQLFINIREYANAMISYWTTEGKNLSNCITDYITLQQWWFDDGFGLKLFIYGVFLIFYLIY